MLFRLIPVGIIPEKILIEVSAEVQQLLKIKIKILPTLDVPREAYDHWRKQYDAKKIMEILTKYNEARFIDKDVPVIFIIDQDIFYNGMNFVFGLEYPSLHCAIVSMTRLKPEFYEKRPSFMTLTDRLVKEIVHEIGHYVGLDHCRHPFCTMCFSPSVEDVDRKEKNYCRDCRIKLTTMGVNI